MNNESFKDESEVIVASVEPKGGKKQTYVYTTQSASISIAQDAVQHLLETLGSGPSDLNPVYLKVVTETVERSKGLGQGMEVGAGLEGAGGINFKKKPAKEVKTTQEAIWIDPKYFKRLDE